LFHRRQNNIKHYDIGVLDKELWIQHKYNDFGRNEIQYLLDQEGKVLLGSASLLYQQPVLLEKGDPIPWNETSGWWEEGGNEDHWFEIPLNTPAIQNDIGILS